MHKMDVKESTQNVTSNTRARFQPDHTIHTNLFQSLAAMSEKNVYSNMFDFLKAAVLEVGEDRSFYTTNLSEILWKCQLWKRELPDVEMFYAVKANPDRTLLRFLVLLGCHFDCATEGEIRAALSAGARPDQIIFANPNMSTAGLKYAKEVGVDLMTFDSEEPLRRIFSTYPRARLLLRICPQDTKCVFDFSEKYGCRLENASQLLATVKGLGMNVIGISFHVGSLNKYEAAFASAVRSARRIFDTALALGFCFSILDIGGGFQGSSGTDDLFCTTDFDLLKRPLFRSSLFGQTLCPRDVLRRDIPFPEMAVGESVLWTNMGAYSQSMSSRFCGFPLPESRYVFRKDSRLRTDWIKNVDEVSRFLADCAYLIKEEDLTYEIRFNPLPVTPESSSNPQVAQTYRPISKSDIGQRKMTPPP